MINFLIFLLQMIVKHVFCFNTDVMKIGGHRIGFSYTVG